jgi:hypothetical protein
MTANDARRLLNLPALPDGDRLENPYVQSGKSLSVGKSEDDSE